jgi:hypothetical protein
MLDGDQTPTHERNPMVATHRPFSFPLTALALAAAISVLGPPLRDGGSTVDLVPFATR